MSTTEDETYLLTQPDGYTVGLSASTIDLPHAIFGTLVVAGVDIGAAVAGAVTLTTAQTITGKKTFAAPPELPAVTAAGNTILMPAAAGTLALTSQIPTIASAATTAPLLATTSTATNVIINGLAAVPGQGFAITAAPAGGGDVVVGNAFLNQSVTTAATPSFAGVVLSATDGTPSTLAYYKSGTVTLNWSGARGDSVVWNFTRVGSAVTLTWASAPSVSNNAGAAIISSNTLPASLVPAHTVTALVAVYGVTPFASVGLLIINTAGVVAFTFDINGAPWPAIGNNSYIGSAISYCVA